MATISIQKYNLPGVSQIAKFIEMRMAEVVWHEENQTSNISGNVSENKNLKSIDCFVCSKDFVQKMDGINNIISIARDLKSKKIMIISSGKDVDFKISTEMKGNLIYINFASEDVVEEKLINKPSQNYSLQMAVTMLLDEDHVAVSDKKSIELMSLAKKVGMSDVTVLINGPTGTGKEVLAKFIHNKSTRNLSPFVAVNCAAIPENMLEAILFGHEKGAFTGASTANKGIFRAAEEGTLLLDEISEMPLSLQSKLLRALQERKVTPLGSQREIEVNVRVIATTNRQMLKEVRDGRFREDLFYRLNVFPLNTHNLSDRSDDIVSITTFLLNRHSLSKENIPFLENDAIKLLLSYKWPGNVRELENVLQRALVLCSDNKITSADIVVDSVIEEKLSSKSIFKENNPETNRI